MKCSCLNNNKICIFDSDLVWRMQLMIIKGKKFVLCRREAFIFNAFFIAFVIQNLSRIYFCIPEILTTNVFEYKSRFEFVL